MATEDDILRDAIIGTEKEIFGDAFGQEELTHDETGDRSLEAMGDGLEGQVEPDEDDDDDDGEGETAEAEGGDGDKPSVEEPEKPAEVKAEAEPKQEVDEPKGRVPAGRLREEAERARAAIAERDAIKAQFDAEKTAAQKQIADLNAKFDALLALQRQAAPQAPKPVETAKPTPDLFEDPNAFAEHLNRGVQEKFDALVKQMRDREVDSSIEAARTRHGKAFDDALGALKGLDFKSPENVALVRRMEASSNPGESILSWHKRNEAMRAVGDDLAAYNARVADETRNKLMADPEFRKEFLASLRGEATGDQGRPRTGVKLPKSLSQAAGSNARSPDDLEIFDGSEGAVFSSAWST